MAGRQDRNARGRRQSHARQAGMGDRYLGKTDVALVVQNPVDHDRRDDAEERQIEVRPLFQEPASQPRQVAIGQRRQRRDPQRTGPSAADFFGGCGDAFESDKGSLDFHVERRRGRRRHKAAAASLEQFRLEQRLKVAQQPADRRLCHGHQLCGLRHTACQHHRAEGFDLP
jgi:hypothetical protein